jgi:tRNA(adenine34) deaminase
MTHEYWLLTALKLAKRAEICGDVPVGAIIIKDNRIIGRGYNKREKHQNPMGHAEIMAITSAAKHLGSWRLEDCTLYVTLEPCPMCAAALVQCRIQSVYFGALDTKGGAFSLGFGIHNHQKLNHRYGVHHIPVDECGHILSEFFRRRRKQLKHQKHSTK